MKRILFVDDEPNLLDALRRMLRPLRPQWDMAFALGAEEALKILETMPVDVVVTDMRMPGMDGAELLLRVHTYYPNALRIVLSGHFDVEAAMRAVPVAHQFLTKPCEPEKLRAAIERSSHLTGAPPVGVSSGNAFPDEATRRFVGATGALPSPPRSCSLLLEAIEDPNVSMSVIGNIIDDDVAMAAKVLQLVNSGFFALPREVSNVVTAVNLLGMNVLKELVLSAGFLRAFRPARAIRGFTLEQFEQHSRLTANIAGFLSEETGSPHAGVVAALLHDAGKLILAANRPQDLERAIEQSRRQQRPLYQCELEFFGTSHAEIGGYLLGLWGLPSATVDAITNHHRPAAASGFEHGRFDLRALLQLANALAHEQADEAPDPKASDKGPPSSQVDPKYLLEMGIAERLPEWQTKARLAWLSGSNHVR